MFTDNWVELTFHKFEVEPTDNCTFDYLEIRQGVSPSGSLVGRLCGMGQPGQLLSKGPMWMKFSSDVSVTMKGFKGKFDIRKLLSWYQNQVMIVPCSVTISVVYQCTSTIKSIYMILCTYYIELIMRVVFSLMV